MQRAGLFLLLTIAVVIGITTRNLVAQPSRSLDPPVVAAAGDTGTAFYDALNDALGGTSLEPLSEMLSSIYVDHDADTGEARSRDAFLDELRAQGSADQRVRLEPTFVEATAGGYLIVGIRPVYGGELEITGMTVEQAAPETHFEVLRVQRGKIVDRWAPRLFALDATEPVEAIPPFSSTIGFTTSLMRVELTGSDERSWRSPERGIVMGEAGSVALSITVTGGAESLVILEKGTFTSIPPGAQVRMRVAVGSSASVVIYQVTRLAASEVAQPGLGTNEADQGGASSVLWKGLRASADSDTLHRLAWTVLPAHGQITLTRPADSVLLIGALAAGIEVAGPDGRVTVLGDDRWPMMVDGPVALDAMHAAWVERDGDVVLRNETALPVTLMLVSIEAAPTAGEPGTTCPVSCPTPTQDLTR
jgi:hypothetical protein